MYPVILASSSPRRERLLTQANIECIVYPSDIEENVEEHWTPEQAAQELAKQKAQAVKEKLESQQEPLLYSHILAADTIVAWEDRIYGKPDDEEDAYRMIWDLSRNKHRVVTGVCVYPKNGQLVTAQETSYIVMRPMSEEEIKDYIASGQAMGKAGAIDIETIQERYVENIEGPFDNVVGLPVELVRKLLAE